MDESVYKGRIIAKLKELRKRDKINQQEFAEKCGISYSAVTKYESGQQTIGLIAALKICEAYGIPISELIGEESSTQNKNQTYGMDPVKVCEGIISEGLKNASILSLFGLGVSLIFLDGYIGEDSGPYNAEELLLRLRTPAWEETVRQFEGVLSIGESYSALDKIEAIGKIVRTSAPKINKDLANLLS